MDSLQLELAEKLDGWGVVAVGVSSGEVEQDTLRTRMREVHTDEGKVTASFIRVYLSHPCAKSSTKFPQTVLISRRESGIV